MCTGNRPTGRRQGQQGGMQGRGLISRCPENGGLGHGWPDFATQAPDGRDRRGEGGSMDGGVAAIVRMGGRVSTSYALAADFAPICREILNTGDYSLTMT